MSAAIPVLAGRFSRESPMAIKQLIRAAALGLLVGLASCAQPAEKAAPAQADGAHREVVVIETARGPQTFYAEIADDERERAQGLMFRREMASDHGMLFLFDAPEQLGFWMRNTYIPLDLIFIDENGRVLNIAERAQPYSEANIPSRGPAKAVLEINGGLSSELGIAEGDRVRHPSLPSN